MIETIESVSDSIAVKMIRFYRAKVIKAFKIIINSDLEKHLEALSKSRSKEDCTYFLNPSSSVSPVFLQILSAGLLYTQLETHIRSR